MSTSARVVGHPLRVCLHGHRHRHRHRADPDLQPTLHGARHRHRLASGTRRCWRWRWPAGFPASTRPHSRRGPWTPPAGWPRSATRTSGNPTGARAGTWCAARVTGALLNFTGWPLPGGPPETPCSKGAAPPLPGRGAATTLQTTSRKQHVHVHMAADRPLTSTNTVRQASRTVHWARWTPPSDTTSAIATGIAMLVAMATPPHGGPARHHGQSSTTSITTRARRGARAGGPSTRGGATGSDRK